MPQAWHSLSSLEQAPVVLIGSAPSALDVLLTIVADGPPCPVLLIGMPVGFVGVAEFKRRLEASGLPQILLAAAVNALLRASMISGGVGV